MDSEHLRASLRLQNLIYWAKEKPMAFKCALTDGYVDDSWDECSHCSLCPRSKK